jgi:hypothetical protein
MQRQRNEQSAKKKVTALRLHQITRRFEALAEWLEPRLIAERWRS